MDWAKHMRRIPARMGEDATMTPAAGGAAVSLRIVYTAPYVEALGGPQPGIAASVPRALAMLSDIPDVKVNDTLARGTSEYRIVGVEPDEPSDTVMLQLELQE